MIRKSKFSISEIEEVKEMNPKYLVFAKVGYHYFVRDEDSYIISYLFGYKLKENCKGKKYYSFQTTSGKKIFSKIEKENVNYLIYDSKDENKIIEIFNFKEKNRYKEVLDMSLRYKKQKERVDNLFQDVLKYANIPEFDEEIKKFEIVMKELKTKFSKSNNSVKKVSCQVKEST